MSIDDGGFAFPSICEGMTLRQYYAGQALVGFKEIATQSHMHEALGAKDANSFWWRPDEIAQRCLSIADALIKAERE